MPAWVENGGQFYGLSHDMEVYMHSKAAHHHAQPLYFVQQANFNWHDQQSRRLTDLLSFQLAQDVDGCVGGKPP